MAHSGVVQCFTARRCLLSPRDSPNSRVFTVTVLATSTQQPGCLRFRPLTPAEIDKDQTLPNRVVLYIGENQQWVGTCGSVKRPLHKRSPNPKPFSIDSEDCGGTQIMDTCALAAKKCGRAQEVAWMCLGQWLLGKAVFLAFLKNDSTDSTTDNSASESRGQVRGHVLIGEGPCRRASMSVLTDREGHQVILRSEERDCTYTPLQINMEPQNHRWLFLVFAMCAYV